MDVHNLSRASAARCVAVILMMAASPSAYAQPGDVVVQARSDPDVLRAEVHYRIADIRSLDGQKQLVSRVKLATYQVCPTDDDGHFYNPERADCRAKAWAGAKPQIDRAIERAMSMADNGAAYTITIGMVAQ